jgi:hypothetical protein
MIRALVLLAPLALSGCGLAPTLILSIVGAGLEFGDKVLQLDLSVQQNQPNKLPISAIVAPQPMRTP